MLVSQRASRIQVLVSFLAGKPIVWLVFIAAMFSWPIVRSMRAQRDLPRSRPALGLVRDFALRDQHGGELGPAELRGRIWVANFTAIECKPVCVQSQQMLTKMDELRRRTRNLGDAIRLVTFPVDPERDTAERMLALSATYRASRGTWRFASGPPARVRDILYDFRVAEGTPQTRFVLVDGNMLVRGYYDLADEAALALLLRDVGLLLAPGS